MLAQGFDLGTIFRHESPPKPTSVVSSMGMFLVSGQEEIDKEGHEYHEKGKEDEQAKLQVTEHGKE